MSADHLTQIDASIESLIDVVAGDSRLCELRRTSKYVTLRLRNGRRIDDPSGRLQPGARGSASIKLRTIADVDPELFADWLVQAAALGP
ncbi:hypothetical protein [Antrihabitans stalactiti]|uniref:DUF5655 domain-containing protein n=1 Tax=Antrihabitans stalactiti TaxID=2584121 RepID=A0A848KCG2_9NOCA|nr:hypothetical protein [Antrihabitans stalactiti]NMN96009.1 hypothetical protein [Antrihabitans stalactiti]